MNDPNIIPPIQAVSTPEVKVYQSKWGYHPVSREDFDFLRAVSRRYWESLRQAYRWARWMRKDPKNRFGAEPQTDAFFINRTKFSWFSTTMKDGFQRMHMLRFSRVFECVVKDLREARMPRATPAEVVPVEMSKYEVLRHLFPAEKK